MPAKLAVKAAPFVESSQLPNCLLRCPSRLHQSQTRCWGARFLLETSPWAGWMDRFLEHESQEGTFPTRTAYLKSTQRHCKYSEGYSTCKHLPGGPAISPRRSVKQSLTSSSFILHWAISSLLHKRNREWLNIFECHSIRQLSMFGLLIYL